MVPTPPPPPGPVNSDEIIWVPDGTFILAADQYIYSHWSSLFSFPDNITTTLDNRGKIYQEQISPGYGGVSMGGQSGILDVVKNSGIIVGAGRGEFPSGAYLFSEIDRLENTGEIYALSDNGGARVVLITQSWDSGVINDGLIAAKSNLVGDLANGFLVTTVDLWNGVGLHNKSNGRILAEGWIATAVKVEMGFPQGDYLLRNEGLIEARSLPGGKAAIGVWAYGASVFNSGTIKGDIALLIDGRAVNSGTIDGIVAVYATDWVELTNEATGILRGDVIGGEREDTFLNHGQIFGNVTLGTASDRFENLGDGVVGGIVDLGIGSDVFIGASGADRVAGDSDHDDLSGNGGNDLLLGGHGNDVIIGGLGNDGLFGERGNDVLRTAGGDHVDGGQNDDRIELGDFSFEFAGGGLGTDTLVLPTGTRFLDLAAAIASGRIAGIEILELRGAQELLVRPADVANLTDGGDAMRIVATATDKVDLIGAWALIDSVTVNGSQFSRYGLDGRIVEVGADAAVQILASAPAGAGGLDPIASGASALRPGEASGLYPTPDELYVSALNVFEPMTIYEGELWFTEGKAPAVYSRVDWVQFNIKGALDATNTLQAGAIAIDFENLTSVVNDGVITVNSLGAIENAFDGRNLYNWQGAYAMRGGYSLVNRGTIDVYSLNGVAVGLGAPRISRSTTDERWIFFDETSGAVGLVENHGLIQALAEGSYAFGGVVHTIENTGNVLATGKLGALALVVYGPNVSNSGTIEASVLGGLSGLVDGVYYESIALRVLAAGEAASQVTNSGRIAADVAVETKPYGGTNPHLQPLHLANTGTIEGRFLLLYADDKIDNDGVIIGDLWLGGGVDQYDGSGGTHSGIVYGEDGDDRLIGGAGADNFAGGAGADDLNGNGGADRFIYRTFTDSTTAALDRIRNFQTGVDKIDLTALGRLQLSWSAQTDANDGSNWQLVSAVGTGGTLSIRVDGNLARSDFIDQNAGTTITGTGGDDLLEGGNGADALFVQQGGIDRVLGLDGADGIYFGASLTSLDVVDGGAGTDTLALQGNYADLVLGDIKGIEVLLALSGTDTRFGNSSLDPARYTITSIDANVAAGTKLTVQATGLLAGENLAFNGAAETDGHFRIFAGRGVDTLTGGAGNDGYFFGADGNFTGADRIAGGAGTDSLALRGNYVGATAVVFEDQSFTGIEVLTLLSGHTNEFGGIINTNGFAYDVKLANGNIAAGQRFDIIASNLRGNESVRIDARAELDGSVRVLAGSANDRIWGSAGSDLLYGGLGSDVIDGGAGADIYIYRTVHESAPAGRDNLFFTAGDKLDLSMIDAISGTSANDAFTFIGSNIAFSNVAGELRMMFGNSPNQAIVEGDVNGDGVGDLYIFITSTEALTIADVVL